MEFTLIFSQHTTPQMQIVNVLCDNVADMPRLYKAFQSLMTKSRVQLHTERIKGEVVSKKFLIKMDGICRRDDSDVATSVNYGVASSSSESNTKVDNPYLVTFLIKTPISKWYVVWCSSKNGQQKDMC